MGRWPLMDALLRDMIRHLNISLRNLKFYAADHPAATASVEKAYAALTQIIEQKGEVTLGVVEDTLIIDDSRLEQSESLIASLAEELTVRNIGSLVFCPDLTQDELRAFINCLNRDPDSLAAAGGAQGLFEREGISHIRANEVKYGKIDESSEDGTGLEEAIVAAFLLGRMPSREGDQEGLLSLVFDNPARIGEVINTRFAQMKEKDGEDGHAARAVNLAMEQVGRFLESQSEKSEKHANIMAQIMFSLNPEVQATLYGARAVQEDYPEAHVDSLAMEFMDDEVIRLVCNVYQGGLRSNDVLVRVVSRICPSIDRRDRIASDLGRELMKLGMEEEAWGRLRDDLLWEAYPLTQKVDRLVSRPELTEKDVERIIQIAPPLSDEKQGKQVQRLLKSLLTAVSSGDTNVRAMVARYMADFRGIVESSGQFKEVGLFFCKKLVARLMKEPEESVRDALLASLGAILKEEILKDHLDTGARVVLTLSKSGYLLRLIELSDTLVSQDVTEHVINALADDDEKRRSEASILLKLLGRAVLESVLFVLEREENPDTRRQLMVIVKSMGSEIAAEIVHRLADKRWYVVRSALYVLGEIADDTFSPDLLTSSVYHDDVRVRKEAIRTLGKLKGKRAVKILRELLEEKDDQIRLLALRNLGETENKTAVPHILHFLQKKKLKGEKADLLRQTAIDALARIGDPEAIPALLDMLQSKGFFKKVDPAVRKSVVEALGAFKTSELEEVFQGVIEKETDVGVREVARRALLKLQNPEKDEGVQLSL